MKRYDIKPGHDSVMRACIHSTETIAGRFVYVSDLEEWALRHKATVEGMPCALWCNSRKSFMAGGISFDVNTPPRGRAYSRPCNCPRGDALREIEEIIGAAIEVGAK